MSNANGYGLKRAILYARVSTDEQARSGYSLAQQLEALREHAAHEGYEILEEVADPGQSGASLERPGMDRVRDLVAAGGVSIVLAQDRDRFAREPAYHYLLKREFEEHGTTIRALNDRGDDSPEGELTDGILDQLAKYERAKTAERSRRGKLRKAREGKIIANNAVDFGFRYNDARDGYEVDAKTMAVVRRIFAMVADGLPLNAVAERLTREGVELPYSGYRGVRRWNVTFIRDCIVGDDVYRPHTFDEVSMMVRPEVASRLDPNRDYGIWWFNRRRSKTTQVSVPDGNGGRRYKRRVRYTKRPREEWIAVPVPDSGVPRETVDAARLAIKHNRAPSNAGRRFWELSGGFVHCGLCGHVMDSHTTANPGRPVYFYYACRTRYKKGIEACPNGKYLAAAKVETLVWDGVTTLLKNPEQLGADLDTMIEQERRGALHGNPDREARMWTDKLIEVERKRARYQEMAAADLISFDELRTRLLELDETRESAECELAIIGTHKERVAELEADRDALLGSLMDIAPIALDSLTPEERRRFYKLLGLRVIAYPDGHLEVEFGDGLSVREGEIAQVPCSGSGA
jgi:site-specific DNA recombinase